MLIGIFLISISCKNISKHSKLLEAKLYLVLVFVFKKLAIN